HPEYEYEGPDYNDIAILTTRNEVKFNNIIWPFCLPQINQRFPDYAGVRIAGWGKVNQTHPASTLQIAFIQVMSNARCEEQWKEIAPQNYANTISWSYPQGLTN
ncbi:unnamed protein product, partial [Meganyctiphanes norvegica]